MKITEPSVFTTGKIARLCSVSIRTVARWIESNDLVAYRLPGDSTEYRVTEKELLKFLKKFGLPYEHIEDMKIHDLILVDKNKTIVKTISSVLQDLAIQSKITQCPDIVTAAIKIGQYSPSAIVIDLSFPEIDSKEFIAEIRANTNLNGLKLIVIQPSKKMTEDEISEFKKIGVDYFLKKPISKTQVKNILTSILVDQSD